MLTKEDVEAGIATLEAAIRRLDAWVLVFAALVAVGVLGESVLGILHWIKDRELKPLRETQSQMHERELALLHQETQKSNERAGIAEQRAAEASLALEQLKAPRTLTDLQQNELREALKSFHGVSADVVRFGNTSEIANLTTMLVSPLTEAGWSPRIWSDMGGGAVAGILIVTNPDADRNVQKAAVSLVAALQAKSLTAALIPKPEAWSNWEQGTGAMMGPVWDRSKVAPIRILIGGKP